MNSRIATLLALPVARGTHDPMSGFFALRSSTFQQARRLSPTGYKIALELLCKCRINRVAEVPIHFGRRQLGQSKLSPRQQWRFLVHLSRLYQFNYPKATLGVKLTASALAGAAFAAMTNPVMLPLLSAWSALAIGYATRSNRSLMRIGILLPPIARFRCEQIPRPPILSNSPLMRLHEQGTVTAHGRRR